jgi:hypothetical protein
MMVMAGRTLWLYQTELVSLLEGAKSCLAVGGKTHKSNLAMRLNILNNLPLEVERQEEPRKTPLSASSGFQLAKTLRDEADRYARKAAASRELHGEGAGLFYDGVAAGLRLAASKGDGFIPANVKDQEPLPAAPSVANTEDGNGG